MVSPRRVLEIVCGMKFVRTALFVMCVSVLHSQGVEAKQPNVTTGARSWDLFCDNCHGKDAEGGFGPDLAGGRGLTVDQFRRAIRTPWGIMPALNERQLSDQAVAEVYAFVQTKPKVSEPGVWHWARASTSAPLGQQLYMNTAGCGQCHEPENAYGRMWLGEHAKEADFDYFATQIYNHTDKYPTGRMGTYRRERLPESVLREIYQWMVVDLGTRASVGAVMQLGDRQGDQTIFNVLVTNRGVADVGLDVERVTLFIRVPSAMKLVSGDGAGYAGVQSLASLGLEPRLPLAPHPHDDTGQVERPNQELVGDVAVWKIPRIVSAEELMLSFVLSGPAPTEELLQQFSGSTIHWESPGRNTNGRPPIMVYRDLRLPDRGDHELVRLPSLRAR